MEFINKIKSKLADAKRERYYRKRQLPWQMEGKERPDKAYVPISESRNILVLTENIDGTKADQLKQIYDAYKEHAYECMFVQYVPEDSDFAQVRPPEGINLHTVRDENISDLGEVSGSFIERLRSKRWDVIAIDLDKMSMPMDYLLYLANAKCIISDTNVPYMAADVQYHTAKQPQDNLLTLVIKSTTDLK